MLDVVEVFDLAPKGWHLATATDVWETPHGLASVARRSSEQAGYDCAVAIKPAGAAARLLGDPFGCPVARGVTGAPDVNLVGYDEAHGLLFLCAAAEPGMPALFAIGAASGATAWAIPPPDTSLQVPPSPETLSSASPWTCGESSLRDGDLYVPFRTMVVGSAPAGSSAPPARSPAIDNRIARIAMADGDVEWAVQATFEVRARSSGAPVPMTMTPLSVTTTTTGVVVLGYGSTGEQAFSAGSGSLPAIVHFGFDGTRFGGISHLDMVFELTLSDASPPDGDRMQPYFSRTAAATDRSALLLFGEFIFHVDPAAGDYQAEQNGFQQDFRRAFLQSPPARNDNVMALPFDYAIALRSISGAQMVVEHEGLWVGDIVVDRSRSLYSIHQLLAETIRAVVAVHDTASGHKTQVLFPPVDDTGGDPDDSGYGTPFGSLRMTAVHEGLLVWSSSGRAALLAVSEAAARPGVALDDLYPARGEPLRLRVEGEGFSEFLVAWGHGAIVGPSTAREFEMVYPDAGDFELRVTGIRADGTTATTSVLVHPGIDEPQRLSAIQAAFAPENQNWTFFILGLLLSAVGAIVALLQRRRNQSRIHAELATLDLIAEQGLGDPLEARRDLDDFERSLRQRLASGALRDTQYDILDRRARDVRRELAVLRRGRTSAP